MDSPNPLTANDLERFCNDFFSDWRKHYRNEEYNICQALVTNFISILKPIYKQRIFGEENEAYTFIYVFLMLSKGLGDVIDLAELTKDKLWPDDHLKTESIWFKLWDAKERLNYFNNHCLDQGLLNPIIEQLDKLESFFYDAFGRGIYASPEILVKKAECSICGQNIKSCAHIPNNLYNGIRCKEIVIDMQFLNVSLVQSPYDMRCRLWPWNMTKDFKISTRIMTLDTIDKFIEEP